MVNQFAKRASLKKVRKRGFKGFAYITATFNNTFINITDEKGNSLLWSSAGGNGFKGAKKKELLLLLNPLLKSSVKGHMIKGYGN
jgi:ribosomal protein S11